MENIRREIYTSKERNHCPTKTSRLVSEFPCHSLYISKEQMEKVIDIRNTIEEDTDVGAVLLKTDNKGNKINDKSLAVLVLKPNTDTEHNNKEDKAKITQNNTKKVIEPNKCEKAHETLENEQEIGNADTVVENDLNCDKTK